MATAGYGSLLNSFFEKHKNEILTQYKSDTDKSSSSSSSSSNASESGDSDTLSTDMFSPIATKPKVAKHDVNVLYLNDDTTYNWNNYTDASVNALREAFVQHLYSNPERREKEIITDLNALPNKFDTTKDKYRLLSSEYVTNLAYNLDENSHMGVYCYMNNGDTFALTADGIDLTFTKSGGVCDLQYDEGVGVNKKTKKMNKLRKGKRFSLDLFHRSKPIRLKFSIGSVGVDGVGGTYAEGEQPVPICILEDQDIYLDNKGWTKIQDVTTDDTINGLEVISIQKQDVADVLIRFPQNCFGEGLPNKDVYVTHDHVVHDPVKNILSNAGVMTYEYDFLEVCFSPPKNHTYSILLKQWKLLNINNMKCESLYPYGDAAIKEFSQKKVFKDVSELECIREYMFVRTTEDLCVKDDRICAKEFNNRLGV